MSTIETPPTKPPRRYEHTLLCDVCGTSINVPLRKWMDYLKAHGWLIHTHKVFLMWPDLRGGHVQSFYFEYQCPACQSGFFSQKGETNEAKPKKNSRGI